MQDFLPFLQSYEAAIYAILGMVAVFYAVRLFSAWEGVREVVFGLERELAMRRFRSLLTVMALLILFAVTEYVLVSFVAPAYPREVILSTPTLDMLATPTVTLAARVDAVSTQSTGTPTPTPEAVDQTGCVAGKIEWISPKSGETVSGSVQLTGTVNVPNLGFYKYEYAAQPIKDNTWVSIAANKGAKVNGEIGFWNTTQLSPGQYFLRLIVLDNQNKPLPACVIQVNIVTKK